MTNSKTELKAYRVLSFDDLPRALTVLEAMGTVNSTNKKDPKATEWAHVAQMVADIRQRIREVLAEDDAPVSQPQKLAA